jgi:hypothetical protein
MIAGPDLPSAAALCSALKSQRMQIVQATLAQLKTSGAQPGRLDSFTARPFTSGPVCEECGMSGSEDNQITANPSEALTIARRIVTIPPGHLADSIRLMVRKRELSKAVRSLNALVLDHPQHRPLAKRALQHLGLW